MTTELELLNCMKIFFPLFFQTGLPNTDLTFGSGTVDSDEKSSELFCEPAGIAVDKNGLIHVADRTTRSIEVFTSGGNWIRSHKLTFSPVGIDIDNEQHVIFIADADRKLVARCRL